eukprot:CAMPEP_0119038206 /NCGR_PEP_ID=MMETSP1177-20130426/6958_1 /TAXON_ID=2985 /ORGANISM="Ochromonas sp, Strain CCMP1899" /LENGTH=549 /DNA_ID=CAMNT_0007000449 /DNA_START=426 /DNA_END=2075 /DNA_ORIENTATION=-
MRNEKNGKNTEKVVDDFMTNQKEKTEKVLETLNLEKTEEKIEEILEEKIENVGTPSLEVQENDEKVVDVETVLEPVPESTGTNEPAPVDDVTVEAEKIGVTDEPFDCIFSEAELEAMEVQNHEAMAVQTSSEEPAVIEDVGTPSLEEIETVASVGITDAEKKAEKIQNETVTEMLDEMTMQAVALRKELEMTVLRDLNALDENALRQRIVQLSAEFFERTKWEGLRLHSSLKQLENEVSKKYLEIMSQQRSELDAEYQKILLEKEKNISIKNEKLIEDMKNENEKKSMKNVEEITQALNTELFSKLRSQEEAITADLQDQMNHTIGVMRESHTKELVEIQETIESLQGSLKSINDIIDDKEIFKNNSVFLHKQISAILLLEDMMSTNKSFEKALTGVKNLCKDETDNLVLAVIERIPKHVQMTGALTVSDLKIRFNVVKNEVRKAAYVPEKAPTILGQLIGSASAYMISAPRGYVKGESVDDVMARTAYLLDHNLIPEALKELDNVTGYPKVLISDWIDLAEARVTVDQSVKILRANSVIRLAAVGAVE